MCYSWGVKFSNRTNWPTAPNEIAKLKTALEKAGETVLDLTISNPTQCEFQYLKPELLKLLTAAENLSYTPDPRGLLSAREAVSQHYARKGILISPDQVFLTAGTSEAYTFIFRLLANPGETILAPGPSYPLFDYLAGLSDLAIKRYPLVYENGWRIRSLPKTSCRAVLVVNPNNPTGNFIHSGELDLVNRFAKTNGAAIISDEVFFDFSFEKSPSDIKSFAQNQGALTFTLGGVSKSLGLPQMKLAWMVVTGPEALKTEAMRRLEIICDTYLSVNTPSQNALSFWLENAAEIHGEISNRLNQNRSVLIHKLSGIPPIRLPSTTTASLLQAEGGWYATIEIEDGRNDEEWALLFLKESHVFVHPGYLFDFPEGNFLVLSLLTPPQIFEEAVDRMAAKFSLVLSSDKSRA